MLERFKGLNRGQIMQDYLNRKRATVNPMTPADAADYFDAFVENAGLNPDLSDDYRAELKQRGLDAVNRYEPEFRDEVLKLIDERGEARLNKQLGLADEAIAEAVAHDKPLYEATLAAKEFHNLKNDPRVRALFRDARGFKTRQEANQSTFRKAGVPIEMIDDELGVNRGVDDEGYGVPLRALKNELKTGKGKKRKVEQIPEPAIYMDGNNEIRVHTKYETNPFTDQREVVPYLDAGTDDALVTRLGMLNINPMTKGGPDMSANELVALNLAKLMNSGIARENKQTVNGKPQHHYADIKLGDQNVELMIARRGGKYDNTVNIPRYTGLYKRGDYNLASKVNDLRSEGLTIEQAVNKLANDGYLESIDEKSMGKLARANIENVGGDPEAVYDKLLVTGYDKDLVQASGSIKNGYSPNVYHPLAEQYATDRLAVAPETMHMINLPGLRNAIDSGKVSTDIFSNPNKGVRGTGRERTYLPNLRWYCQSGNRNRR